MKILKMLKLYILIKKIIKKKIYCFKNFKNKFNINFVINFLKISFIEPF